MALRPSRRNLLAAAALLVVLARILPDAGPRPRAEAAPADGFRRVPGRSSLTALGDRAARQNDERPAGAPP